MQAWWARFDRPVHLVHQGSCFHVVVTDRGGYRKPPELAEGGKKGSSGTEGNHRKTGREAERPPHSSSGGQPGPKASADADHMLFPSSEPP